LRHRKPAPPRRGAPLAEDQALPPLGVLEEFTHASLSKWRTAGKNLNQFSQSLFFDLEKHRNQHSNELLEAIRSSTRGPFEFKHWGRLVDYQYTNQPLSTAGSVKRDGGRFNIGGGLNPATYSPFPALYVAEDFETAYREKFSIERSVQGGGLTTDELALRRESSFTFVGMSGRAESVLDIGDPKSLQATAKVLAQFKMPRSIASLGRMLHLKPPDLVRSANGLQRQLLHPYWRAEPAQHGLPSNSQIFGRLCVAAGVQAILYPSTRNGGKRCIALLTQNWKQSSAYVELDGLIAPEVRVVRVDGSSA
jgi:RES domain-containing protein